MIAWLTRRDRPWRALIATGLLAVALCGVVLVCSVVTV